MSSETPWRGLRNPGQLRPRHGSNRASEDTVRQIKLKLIQHRATWFSIAGALGLCLSTSWATNARAQAAPTAATAVSSAKKSYAPASIHALPGLQCKLYPAGSAPSAGLSVFTDDDGYARFHAVRAVAGDAVQRLTLDCTDSAGKPSSYLYKF